MTRFSSSEQNDRYLFNNIEKYNLLDDYKKILETFSLYIINSDRKLIKKKLKDENDLLEKLSKYI